MGVFKNGYNHSSLFSSEPSIAAGRRSTCKNFQIREQASASSRWPNAYAPSRRRNHQFVSTSPWGTASLEQVLFRTADALVGGKGAVLIVDDTTLPRQDKHSFGARRQHCGALDKQANCQVLVSRTLEQREVPAPITLALYLSKTGRRAKRVVHMPKVPESVTFEAKGDIALAQTDAALADSVRFGMVLADTLLWQFGRFSCWPYVVRFKLRSGCAVHTKVYLTDVRIDMPANPAVRCPAKYAKPSIPSKSVVQIIDTWILMPCSAVCGAATPKAYSTLALQLCRGALLTLI
jgi:hypothetical protein